MGGVAEADMPSREIQAAARGGAALAIRGLAPSTMRVFPQKEGSQPQEELVLTSRI